MLNYILLAITAFLIGLFTKDYLPNYMKKKAENLATKEDIADITRKTEDVKHEFQREFASFSNTLKFRNEYANEQYTQLYAKLYTIVIQSEYCRKYINDISGVKTTFDEEPYIEISPTKKQKTVMGEGFIKRSEEIVETDISQTNKKLLYELVINNSQYASQELLKISVAYRFAYSMHGPNEPDDRNNEEFRLLKLMLIRIIKEYNNLRKSLQFDYNDIELDSGNFDAHIFE